MEAWLCRTVYQRAAFDKVEVADPCVFSAGSLCLG